MQFVQGSLLDTPQLPQIEVLQSGCRAAKLQPMAAWRVRTPACHHRHMHRCKVQLTVTTTTTASVAHDSIATPNNHPYTHRNKPLPLSPLLLLTLMVALGKEAPLLHPLLLRIPDMNLQ